MCWGELSAVTPWLMSKFLWSRWKWQRGVKWIPSPFPCCPVNRECSWKKTQIEKKKNYIKNRFFSNIFNIITIKNKFMIGISWLVSHEVCIHIQYFFGVVRNKLQTKEDQKFEKRICHVNHALYFDQWKTFSTNYKPMRVWLRLVYKFTENYCRSRLFSKFIQTQKRYPTSLDKVRILTWKLLVISS